MRDEVEQLGAGRGKEVGGGLGVETCILSFCPATAGGGLGAAAILAGLQPLQGTWSLPLSFKVFLFIHT